MRIHLKGQLNGSMADTTHHVRGDHDVWGGMRSCIEASVGLRRSDVRTRRRGKVGEYSVLTEM